MELLEQLKGWPPLAYVLGAIIIASFFEVWVWGKLHRAEVAELKAERDEYKTLAFKIVGFAENSVDIKRKVPRDVS